jgi:alkylhydroperoxidase family enzyme
MLGFARRLTKNSGEIRREGFEKIRESGFDDAAIVDLVSVTAYFNFINRVAQGLGVYLDEPLRARTDPEELREEKARLGGDSRG